jgi:hypothetical protein
MVGMASDPTLFEGEEQVGIDPLDYGGHVLSKRVQIDSRQASRHGCRTRSVNTGQDLIALGSAFC